MIPGTAFRWIRLLALGACAFAAPALAADPDDSSAQDLQDRADRRVSDRLAAAGGAWENRASETLPDGGAPAAAAAAPASAAAGFRQADVPLSPPRVPMMTALDHAVVPPPAAAPAASARAGSAGLEVSAQAALAQALPLVQAPRPPGGLPTELLEPAARSAAQALLGTPARSLGLTAGPPAAVGRAAFPFLNADAGPSKNPLVSWKAAESGDAVVVTPTFSRNGFHAGAAVSMDNDAGGVLGNPTLKTGVALGRSGAAGATSLDVDYRPGGRQQAETAELSGETVLFARKRATVKLNGSVAMTPLAETAYKVGATVLVKIF